MLSSIYRGATRTVLFALLLQGLVTACDVTAPVDPKSSTALAPADASLTVSASGLSATVISWGEIDISWASNPSASGFQVFRFNGATGSYDLIATTVATARSYPNTGLTGSTQYCYEVRSFKVAGKNTNYSAYVGPVCATTLAPPVVAPSETDAVPEGSGVRVKWKDNSADENGFQIERSNAATGPWTAAGTAAANAISVFLYAPTEQLSCFRVIAFNTFGPSQPSTPDCTKLPAAPTSLSAKALDLQSITLSWTDNSAVEDGYAITRFEQGGVESYITTLPPNTVSYRDAGVRPDVAYTYRVLAMKDGGYSSSSNQAIGVVSTTAPGTPTWFHVAYYLDTEGYGWNYLTFYWDGEASTNEDGFRVESSPDGLSGWSLYSTTDANVNYIQQQFSVFDPPPPAGCYRVIAFNAVGVSSPSSPACNEPGVVPTDLVATAVDQESIDLTWTDNASLETGYVVIRATGFDGEYSVVANLPKNAMSFHDTGLVSGQEYWYLVAFVNEGGDWSNYSNYAAAIPGSASLAAPRSPTVISGRAAPTRPVRGKPVPLHVPPRPSPGRTR